MLPMLSRNWPVLAVRGVAGILFGLLAFVLPGLTLASLVLLFGAFALVDGGAMLVAALRGDRGTRGHRWLTAAIGVAGVSAGFLTWVNPAITALALLYVVATWAVLVGILQLAAAITLRRELAGELWLLLGGIASIAFGVLLLTLPGTGLLALAWLVGGYAIVFGVSSLALAFRLRSMVRPATAGARR